MGSGKQAPYGDDVEGGGEVIGEQIGSCLDVDVGENDMAVGRYLRVKVRLDIRAPILRVSWWNRKGKTGRDGARTFFR